MRTLFILLNKELKEFFLSPIAYITLTLTMVVTGVAFILSVNVLSHFAQSTTLAYLVFHSSWFWIFFPFIFPLITMRLFAEEKKMGTLEIILTAPVRTWHVVFSKYLATLIFYIILWIPSVLNFYIFQVITGEDAFLSYGSFLGTYLILIIVGAFYIAIGCLASSMTSNQIIAAILTFSFINVHFTFGFLDYYQGLPHEVLSVVRYLFTYGHFNQFAQGLINTKPLIYYTSFALLLLAFTHQIVNYQKWKA